MAPQGFGAASASDFLEGLVAGGSTAGRDVQIEYCRAAGHFDRLPPFAMDLVEQHVGVIAAIAPPAAAAAKAATTAIPVVFASGVDPDRMRRRGSFATRTASAALAFRRR